MRAYGSIGGPPTSVAGTPAVGPHVLARRLRTRANSLLAPNVKRDGVVTEISINLQRHAQRQKTGSDVAVAVTVGMEVVAGLVQSASEKACVL